MMIACALALALQQEEFEELLRRFQEAFEARESVSDISREAETASAAAKLNTPEARESLWRTVANESLPAPVRLAAIDALRRMGGTTDVTPLIDALSRLSNVDEKTATRAVEVGRNLRRHREQPRTAVEDVADDPPRAKAAPVRKDGVPEDDKVYRKNLIFGGVAAALAILLLVLRKRP